MSINKKATAEVEVTGAPKAEQDFRKIGDAGKKAGKDISDAFTAVGRSLATFGASVVDAVVDVKQLDPSAMVKTFEDYSRSLTRTAIAAGQSLDGLKQRYQELSRANAVMPQSIDAFAKSVGRMTYDIRGGIDAFTGLHNAALAFGETDQEQVGFAAYLKNVQGVAGDTTAAVGKLFAQAEKLSTVGGARALRDLFVSMGSEVDRLVSRMGAARAQTEGLAAVLTKGATGPQAQRIAAGALGFLGSSPLDIQRTLGRPLFDQEGRYKDTVGTYQGLYDLMRKPVSEGGRGMDDERILMAFQASLGMEAGSAMYQALKSGRLGQARGLAKLGASGTAAAAGAAYRASPIGQIDASRIGIFEAQMDVASPLFDMKGDLSSFVGAHPFASLGIAYGVKAALSKALPKLAPKLLPGLVKGGLGALGAGLSVLPIEDIFLPDEYQNKAGSGSELSSAPLAELLKERALAGKTGTPVDPMYGPRARDIAAGERALARDLGPGVNAEVYIKDQSIERLAEALKMAFEHASASTARDVEADKDPESRN